MNKVTYSREPTSAEVKFGYGARHYADFNKAAVVKPTAH